MQPLGIGQINQLLKNVPDWGLEDSGRCIQRIFEFPDFKKAVEFTEKIVPIAPHVVQKGKSRKGNKRNSTGQTVQTVNHVNGIGDTDDTEDGQRQGKNAKTDIAQMQKVAK